MAQRASSARHGHRSRARRARWPLPAVGPGDAGDVDVVLGPGYAATQESEGRHRRSRRATPAAAARGCGGRRWGAVLGWLFGVGGVGLAYVGGHLAAAARRRAAVPGGVTWWGVDGVGRDVWTVASRSGGGGRAADCFKVVKGTKRLVSRETCDRLGPIGSPCLAGATRSGTPPAT